MTFRWFSTKYALDQMNQISIGSVPLLGVPTLVLRLYLYILLAGSALYVSTIVWGLSFGYALPTTAAMGLSSIVKHLAGQDYVISYLALMLICMCVLSSWSVQQESATHVEREQEKLRQFVVFFGLPIALCLFVFSLSGAWAGIPREGDSNASSIGGLIAFADANGYVTSAQDQLKTGLWNSFSLRRPIAAALRSVLFILSGLSIAKMIFLQTVIACVATCFATREMIRWRGVYAGLVFFCISFLVFRSFFTTALTEPIALIFSMISLPFFIQSLRTKCASSTLIAITLFTIGLLVRMGAMFVVPAMLFWTFIYIGDVLVSKVRTAVCAAFCILAVLFCNWLLVLGYGNGPDVTGSNFALTLCGLSIGDLWSACQERYAAKLSGLDERSQADVLYSIAFNNILQQPVVFITRLFDGAIRFIAFLPNTLLRGYLWNPMPAWFSRTLVLSISAAGLVCFAVRRREQGELLFWLCVGAGSVSSAAFVYYDAGARVMCVSYPLIVAFIASGFFSPSHVSVPPSLSRIPATTIWTATIVVLVLVLILPKAAHLFFDSERSEVALISGTHAVFGGKQINGFLIVRDGDQLPKDIPAMHYSNFEEIIKLSNIEIYQSLLHPQSPALPFGFIAAPRAEAGVLSGKLYIVPKDVFIRSGISVWRFNVVNWPPGQRNADYWLYVEKAEPIE